jgi:hypothetical protein
MFLLALLGEGFLMRERVGMPRNHRGFDPYVPLLEFRLIDFLTLLLDLLIDEAQLILHFEFRIKYLFAQQKQLRSQSSYELLESTLSSLNQTNAHQLDIVLLDPSTQLGIQ